MDGIILIGTVITAEHRKFLKNSKVPVVVVGQYTKYANCIYHDDYGAGKAMGKAVAESLINSETEKEDGCAKNRACGKKPVSVEKWHTSESQKRIKRWASQERTASGPAQISRDRTGGKLYEKG